MFFSKTITKAGLNMTWLSPKIDFDTVQLDIIAYNKAKEKAAKKCNLPFQYGDEIDATGILKQNPKRVKVDLTNVSNYKRYTYNKLVKKYSKQEFNKIVNPISHSIILVTPVVLIATLIPFCLIKCTQVKKAHPKPVPIQKGHILQPNNTNPHVR